MNVPGAHSVANRLEEPFQEHEVELESLLTKERTPDYLKILLRKEADLYPHCNDYVVCLEGDNNASSREREEWRRTICEWCFGVADHFNFDREVVSYAVSYMDRTVAFKTVSSGKEISKRLHQLIAITSLYTAIKVHGEVDMGPRRKLNIHAYVELSRKFFTVQDIEAQELDILKTLNWEMNPPTCLRFIQSLLDLYPKWAPQTALSKGKDCASVISVIYDFALYLTELSLCVSAFSFTHPTSVTAFAAILCGMEAVHHATLPMPMPDHVRGAFLVNIAEATGLTMGDSNVQRVYHKLKALSPASFGRIDDHAKDYAKTAVLPHVVIPQEEVTSHRGTVTPVSVIDLNPQDNENADPQRKRIRPS